jgi:hypothetical protein
MVKGNGLALRRSESWLPPFDTRQPSCQPFTCRSREKLEMTPLRVLTSFAGVVPDMKRFVSIHLASLALTISMVLFSSATAFNTLSAQCALVCKNTVNVYFNANGVAIVTPELLLANQIGCNGDNIVEVADNLGNRFGNNIPVSQLGKTLMASVANSASGNSCASEITVLDNLPPVIDGPDTIWLWCNQPYSTENTGVPFITDNTTLKENITVTFKDEYTDFPCMSSIGGVFITASVKRTWTATDASGNKSIRVQNIYLKRATLDMVVFPKHRDGVIAPALECTVDNPLDLRITGQPIVEGTKLDITTFCDLLTSSNDQSIPICGGSKRIIRTWTVFDLCTNDFRVFSQVIVVNDTRKPELTCPPNLQVSTVNTSCSAAVALPKATATDACSGAEVVPSWQFGTGFGPFANVPVGTHKVTYSAKDGCSNTTTCEITVTVKDESRPTAICQSQVAVNLQNDGKARIFAASYNNGSHDNCGIDYYRVSRDEGPYTEVLDFDCSDMNKTINIRLKAVDKSGNESYCNSSTVIRDDVKPEITCPAPTTVNCGTNFNNPALTGIPVTTDNCSLKSTTYTNAVNLNTCGIGTVVRIWTAVDGSGNTSTCQQTINVVDNTTITIEFPKDILTYQCNPNLDTAITGTPKVIGRDCEQLQITSTDYYFYTAQPACFKLLRKWAVINWCVYQPNDPNNGGFWEHTQVIEVRDTIVPVLTCPKNMTVEIQSAQCQAFVDVPLPVVSDCSKTLTFTNTSSFADNSLGKASGTYQIGTHNITYVVADGCGNSASCKTMVTVKDAQAPTPVCNNGVTVTIQPTGSVTLTPAMLNGGSRDNCTDASKLILQVSPNTFNCQNLGNKTVTLTVTDESGNSAFCNTTVVIQDNFKVCEAQATVTIAGKIARESGEPASQKPVSLTGAVTINAYSDVDGTFAFPNLPMGKIYTITPAFNSAVRNGVTTLDMVYIRRHILGVEQLATPYKVIAADVNKSGSVTTLDLVELQKLILNVSTSLPNNTPSWRFIDASYTFSNPKNPFSQQFPESITITNIDANHWNKNFVAIKVGDVNDSAIPTNLEGTQTENRNFEESVKFTTPDISLKIGQEYLVPFKTSGVNEIAGVQFTINFDENALKYEGFASPLLRSMNETNIGVNQAEKGLLTLGWINTYSEKLQIEEPFVILRFKAIRNTRLSEVLAINSAVTPAEAYTGDVQLSHTTFKTYGVKLEFAAPQSDEFKVYQNAPNPFYQNTLLKFYLPKAAEVNIRIYDVYGRLLMAKNEQFAKGMQELSLDFSHMKTTGLLFAEIEAEGYQRQTLRMHLKSD